MQTPRSQVRTYLPMRLMGVLHGDDGTRPAAAELAGAVLVVDVSRFTALVESMSRRGQAGLEEIPRQLGLAYDFCVDQIVATGGEVVRFSGDSILAFWPDVADTPVQAALDCARAICELPVGSSTIGLNGNGRPAFHAGIGAGRFCIGAIGGNPTWNIVAGGPAFQQAMRALSRADAGQYILSASAQSQLALTTGGRMRRGRSDGAVQLRADSVWLDGFLSAQMRQVMGGLRNGGDGTARKRQAGLSDIRPTSVLFARVEGLSLGPGDSLWQVQRVSTEIQRILRSHDGPSGDFFFDDSGLVCLAAFGASGVFHHDDASRAIRAGQVICAEAEKLELLATVGVATGDALSHLVGSGPHCELMLLGQPVNRAARLMTQANQGVICDPSTEHAARGLLAFEQQGVLQLPGLGDAVPVFRPIGAEQVASQGATMIGRDAELRKLRKAFAETRAHSKRLVAVLGESGIGKTTLAMSFIDELHGKGVPATYVSAQRDDHRTAMLAWRRVLEALVGVRANGDGNRVYQAILNRIPAGSELEGSLPLLGDVLAIDIDQTERTVHLEGAHRADATMRAISEVIGLLAPRPFVLVLEDSQWLDSASWRLVEWVFGSLDAVLVVLCVRSDEIPDQLRVLRQRAETRMHEGDTPERDLARHFRAIDLTELNEKSVIKLIGRTLDHKPVDESVTRRIAQLAGGNPFFLEEISQSLRNEGLIALRDGCWQSIRPLDSLVFFEGIEKVIRERVDRLDLTAQSVLRAASVIGRSFDTRPLASLHGGPVDAAVAGLVDAQLLHASDDPYRFAFRHDQIRDVVYNSIQSDQKRALHGALALWYETQATQPGAPGGDTAVLVRHFEAAGELDKAVSYADLAATEALRTGAYREVEAFIRICLDNEYTSRAGDVVGKRRSVRWRRQLAEAHYGRGDVQAQGIAIREALSVAGQRVPEYSTSIYARLVTRALRLLLMHALKPEDDMPAPRPSADWDAEISRCLNQAATVDYFELRFTRGMCNLLGAVLRSERTGVSADSVLSNCQLAAGLGMMGWRSMNARLMNRAERFAIALQDPSIYSHVCNLDALWQLGQCEWPGVDRRLDQAQDLARQAGDQLRWCNAQGMRFWSQYYRGMLGQLEDTSRLLLLRAQNAGNLQQEIWALRCKALCFLHTDRPREAVDILNLTTSSMTGSVDLAAQISATGALSLALSRIGRQQESLDQMMQTMELLDRMSRPSSHSVIVGISSVLEVLLRGREAGLSERYEDWRDWEDNALRKLREYSRAFVVGRAQLGLWVGLRDWLDGRHDKAMALWQEAEQTATAHGLNKDQTLIAAEIRHREVFR
ncbi:AAA and adenylate/guanylate cyclase domain-containing protein [Ruegeria arenilitoris]|uniref:AAA and adenylate/guanylate cyclase domain-containing protein n=1 Tax=Ruegeria arenilitoris TaxID=1173585 RepID=UPI001479B30E|nr:AAA and adenylate/guanylate cyclase domain-containing protein [Ruegeria arenilitoris]